MEAAAYRCLRYELDVMSGQLLRHLTLEQLLSAPYGEIPSRDARRADRPEENRVTFSRHPACNYTDAFVLNFTRQYTCLCSWDGYKDTPGHLNHYYDRVLCGQAGYRLVFFQDSMHNFQVLIVFPCDSRVHKTEYSDYLTDLESRWYGL